MKKERLKTVVLIALVISSLVMTGQIWFNEKLWPEGYNFFVNIKTGVAQKISDVFGFEKTNETVSRTSITTPAYLAAYMVKDFDHAITVLDYTNQEYAPVNEYVSSVIWRAMTTDSKNVTNVSEEDWRKALFTRGFYVDYGVDYKANTFAQIFGANTFALSENISSLRRFIITAQDSLVSDVSVYITDESDGEFYKISTGLDKTQFNDRLMALTEQATPKKRFSFFINADVPTGMAGEVVFAPYLILNEEAVQRKKINASNPLLHDGELDMSAYTTERLLRTFSINPKTAVKYTDAEGSIIFVQSKNTLKISKDGVLSYTTVAGGKGLKLGQEGIQENAATLSEAIKLVAQVCSTLIEDDYTQLYLSGLNETQTDVKASFDYIYDGVPIIFGGHYEGKSAAEIEFEQGYLKSYTQVLRRYRQSGNISTTESTYDAKIFDDLSEEEKKNGIEKLFEAYDDDGTEGEKRASWFVKINGIDSYRR
ncbi:MAG: hypothetical protein E7410_00370 [Ruminococcaceae bacterium]|nr:hypothetical protein [Oscillospiraceae bacterium]